MATLTRKATEKVKDKTRECQENTVTEINKVPKKREQETIGTEQSSRILHS